MSLLKITVKVMSARPRYYEGLCNQTNLGTEINKWKSGMLVAD